MPRPLPAALAALAALAAAGLARAQEPPPEKRTEGRYFVEAAEIMLRANDFDMVLGSRSRDGGAPQDVVAELSGWDLHQPKITLGLNRPGKTSFVVAVHDFEMDDSFVPRTFEDADDQIVATTLLPPGIRFQRQRPGTTSPFQISPGVFVFPAEDDEFVPNWGEEFGHVRSVDYRSLDLAVHRTAYENTRFRVRWVAGLRYAELRQQVSLRMAFAEEADRNGLEVRDFLSVQAAASTHGIGPHVGLNGRIAAGANRKWQFTAQGDVAMIPESTNASYALSLVDNSAELWCLDLSPSPSRPVRFCGRSEAPVMPGIGTDTRPGSTFNATVRQTDFTDLTWLLEGTVGVRYQISRGISIGLEGWHLRWMNVLTDIGVIDTIHEEATYEVLDGNVLALDPQLRDTESVIHVPRFTRRDDVSFDGVSLNLRFEF